MASYDGWTSSHHTAVVNDRWCLSAGDTWNPVRWWHPLDLYRFQRDRRWARREFGRVI